MKLLSAFLVYPLVGMMYILIGFDRVNFYCKLWYYRTFDIRYTVTNGKFSKQIFRMEKK